MLMFILAFFLPAASSSATCLSPLSGTQTPTALPPAFLCSLSLLSNWPCAFPAAGVQLIRPQYLNSPLPFTLGQVDNRICQLISPQLCSTLTAPLCQASYRLSSDLHIIFSSVDLSLVLVYSALIFGQFFAH